MAKLKLIWTYQDFLEGRCADTQIGSEKPPEPEPESEKPPIPLDTKISLRQRLREDALQAYHELGGVEYLKSKPELLDKVLARVIAPDPLPANTNVFQFPEMPWLSARRLMYQESMAVLPDIAIEGTEEHARALAAAKKAEPPSPND